MVNGNPATAGDELLAARGSDAFEILKNDHQVIKRLFDQLAAVKGDGRQAVLGHLKALLTVHNATEENLVYPAVRIAAGRPEDADALYHQQDEAKVGVWKLDSILKGTLDDDFEGVLSELTQAVHAHINKEEGTEFPALLESLPGDGLSALTQAVLQFRSGVQMRAV